jgi:Terminase large subunit, T4likevirus-type, N-terminal
MTLQRRLTRLQVQHAARQSLPADGCQDTVDVWQRVYGFAPNMWQVDVLRSPAPRVLMNTCRQSGKSTVAAVLGLYEALYHAPALVLFVSASLRQAQELGKKLFDGYRALGKPVSADSENRLSLELASGSRIVCLPSEERTVRGFSGTRLIVADEASRVDDALYHSIRPMLAASQGRLIALSTPWGRRGWWHKAWTEEREWYKVEVPADQCPRISAAFLQEERRSLPDFVFRQEYLCEFTDTEDAVFRYEDIYGALSDEVTPLFGSPDDAQPFVSSMLLPRP